MGPMVDEMIKNGIAYESEGAYVIDVKQDSDKKEMPPCIVRKVMEQFYMPHQI